MKITMYELLGLVKDDKVPKRFKYDSYVWTYNYESSAYWNGKGIEFEDYMDDGLMKYLNDEVEILEEEKKIPEKMENESKFYSYEKFEEKENVVDKVLYILRAINLAEEKIDNLNDSVNEIIDYLKSKGE